MAHYSRDLTTDLMRHPSVTRLSNAAFRVFAALLASNWGKHDRAFLGLAQAKEYGVRKTAYYESLAELERAGLIERLTVGGSLLGKAATYRIHLPDVAQDEASVTGIQPRGVTGIRTNLTGIRAHPDRNPATKRRIDVEKEEEQEGPTGPDSLFSYYKAKPKGEARTPDKAKPYSSLAPIATARSDTPPAPAAPPPAGDGPAQEAWLADPARSARRPPWAGRVHGERCAASIQSSLPDWPDPAESWRWDARGREWTSIAVLNLRNERAARRRMSREAALMAARVAPQSGEDDPLLD